MMSNWTSSNGTVEVMLIGEETHAHHHPEGQQNQTSRDERLAVIEISTLSVILGLAVTSNLVMLIAIVRQRANRPLSRMYFFMMHLSLADLLVSLFNILPQLAWDITYRFQGGDLLCRFVKYGQIMTLYLSTYILMFMAVDRYRAVTVRNNLHWNSLKVAKSFVGASWIMALLFAVPQAVIFSEQQVTPDGATDCWVQFVEPWGAKAYVTWFVISIFGAPLLVIVVCYGVICRQIWIYSQSAVPVAPSVPPPVTGSSVSSPPAGTVVSVLRRWFLLASLRWRKSRSTSGSHQHNNNSGATPSQSSDGGTRRSAGIHHPPRSHQDLVVSSSCAGGTLTTPVRGAGTVTTSLPQCCHHQGGAAVMTPHLRRSNSNRITKAKMKTIKLTLVVVICFVACWAPFCIAQLVMVYAPPSSETDISSAVVIILLLASLNSCTNPWVYLAFSGSLLNQMRVCIGLGWLRGKDTNDSIGEDDRRGPTGAGGQPHHPSNPTGAAAAALAGVLPTRPNRSNGGGRRGTGTALEGVVLPPGSLLESPGSHPLRMTGNHLRRSSSPLNSNANTMVAKTRV